MEVSWRLRGCSLSARSTDAACSAQPVEAPTMMAASASGSGMWSVAASAAGLWRSTWDAPAQQHAVRPSGVLSVSDPRCLDGLQHAAHLHNHRVRWGRCMETQAPAGTQMPKSEAGCYTWHDTLCRLTQGLIGGNSHACPRPSHSRGLGPGGVTLWTRQALADSLAASVRHAPATAEAWSGLVLSALPHSSSSRHRMQDRWTGWDC